MRGNVRSWNSVRLHRMMTYNRAAFGKNIQEAREMKGWSQTRLAENLHIGKSFVNNWESGFSRPDIRIIPALCRILDIPIRAFYGWPTARCDMESCEKEFLRDYSELDSEDQNMLLFVMRKMLSLEAADMYDVCKNLFVRVPQYDSEDYFKARHGNHLRWIRRGEEQRNALFLVTVSGTSLAPYYEDDDDLIGRRTNEIAEGKHALVLLDEELVILRREGCVMTGLGGTICVPYDDRKKLNVIGEILRRVGMEELPDDKERMVLGNALRGAAGVAC